ncbi:LOW QUALITY PROTEIN: serine/threonine-protein kinase Nek10 [Cyanocitta cristata]
MPDQDKKLKSTEKATDKKPPGISVRGYSDLKRLQSLLSVQSRNQQLYICICFSVTRPWQNVKSNEQSRGQWQESTEAFELEKFSMTCKNERNVSKHPKHQLFQDTFMTLVKNRLTCRQWVIQAPSVHFLRVLICLRLLIRDPCCQVKMLHSLGGIENLAQYMGTVANRYLNYGEEQHNVDKLVNMTYIFQKLAAVKNPREWVIASGEHKTLVNLLSARDSHVFFGALRALTSLAESPECRQKISELIIVENLLLILHEYNFLSERLFLLLCAESQVKEQIKMYEGVPVLLSLHSDHIKHLWIIVCIVCEVCEDLETSVEIWIWGGIKQLLHILWGEIILVSDHTSDGSLSSANAAGRIQHLHWSDDPSPDEIQKNAVSLQAACCAAVTELVLNETNAYQVVQANGIYTIAKLILPNKERNAERASLLWCYAFRALRFLFSMERNQHIFKRLFPTDFFEIFIDIGHYVHDIRAYEGLVLKLNFLKDVSKQIAESIESMNQYKAPTKHIGNAVAHLGNGAFGSVYKVRKHNRQNLLAMKEVNLHNPAFGKDKKQRDSSVKNIVSELTIIKEQLYHPNVAWYYRTFLESEFKCRELPYFMETLIERVPLGEHFHSLKEKQQQFTEDRIWHIFIQLCLALCYLHKEKRIVHGDLTPNNVMLGDKDKVAITDFGLAKQKQENCKLASVVGTILYSVPEVVKSEPYGEKADVWAAGCILYQMATLNPAFYSTNMLSLATKIVGAVYEPVPEGLYSEKVSFAIKSCLTPDKEARPDVVEVISLLSDVMMKYLDVLSTSHLVLEKKLDQKGQTQWYFMEANRNAVTYHHQLSILSQVKKITRSLDSSSSGAASCKSEFSENTDLPVDSCQSAHGKDEERTYEAMPVESHRTMEKGIFCELDNEVDIVDNSSSSSSSNLKEFLIGIIKSFSTFERQPQIGSSLAGIAASQRKVHQISDPVQQILVQLHKIIFLTQLPPALQCNLKRRIIEIKKSLFSQQSNPCNLKSEIKKLLQGSPELIEPNIFTADWHGIHLSSGGNMLLPDDRKGILGTSGMAEGMTHQQLQTIEEVLVESGYYSFSSNRLLGFRGFYIMLMHQLSTGSTKIDPMPGECE